MSEHEAGPALDALVQEHVFGRAVAWWCHTYGPKTYHPKGGWSYDTIAVPCQPGDANSFCIYRDDEGIDCLVPEYSTTGDGTLLVIERMRADGWSVDIRSVGPSDYRANFGKVVSEGTREALAELLAGEGWARTLPHAVALAALAAKEGRNE